jgi:uncharacterized zinc-type alcohol dehydrogenase-like protein
MLFIEGVIDMLPTKGYAAPNATTALQPFSFDRREPKPHDVVIKILYCGICHSDIHMARNEWGVSTYPMVTGHEIVGTVERVGSEVKKFKVGDSVGVGVFVDSCRDCNNCKQGEEQFCEKQTSLTYGSLEQDGKTPTQGGFSNQIVVDENYVLRIPSNLKLENTAPLLCAGITTYSPLRFHNIGPGKRVAILGLGGLGHMGVKFAVAMGADVTVLSTSPNKEQDAKRLGAHHFVVTKDPKNLEAYVNYFDFILDAVSAPHDPNIYLNLLRTNGTLVLVGLPEKPLEVNAFSLITHRRKLAGSLIGGIRETQEMLDYCAKNNITADVEVIPMQKVNEAFERTIKSDVKYRFVIDMNSLKD